MNMLKDHCKCGHAKETHHKCKHDCLGMYCECKGYKLYSDPDEPPTPRVFKATSPIIDPWADMDLPPDCDPFPSWAEMDVYADDDPCPSTLRQFPSGTP